MTQDINNLKLLQTQIKSQFESLTFVKDFKHLNKINSSKPTKLAQWAIENTSIIFTNLVLLVNKVQRLQAFLTHSKYKYVWTSAVQAILADENSAAYDSPFDSIILSADNLTAHIQDISSDVKIIDQINRLDSASSTSLGSTRSTKSIIKNNSNVKHGKTINMDSLFLAKLQTNLKKLSSDFINFKKNIEKFENKEDSKLGMNNAQNAEKKDSGSIVDSKLSSTGSIKNKYNRSLKQYTLGNMWSGEKKEEFKKETEHSNPIINSNFTNSCMNNKLFKNIPEKPKPEFTTSQSNKFSRQMNLNQKDNHSKQMYETPKDKKVTNKKPEQTSGNLSKYSLNKSKRDGSTPHIPLLKLNLKNTKQTEPSLTILPDISRQSGVSDKYKQGEKSQSFRECFNNSSSKQQLLVDECQEVDQLEIKNVGLDMEELQEPFVDSSLINDRLRGECSMNQSQMSMYNKLTSRDASRVYADQDTNDKKVKSPRDQGYNDQASHISNNSSNMNKDERDEFSYQKINYELKSISKKINNNLKNQEIDIK